MKKKGHGVCSNCFCQGHEGLFLSGCQLCSNCFHTLPRAIKEEKKNEEGVGSSKSKRESKVGFLDNEREKREERVGLSGLALFPFCRSKGGSLLRVKGEENKKWFGLSPCVSRFRGREPRARGEGF